MFKLNKMIWHLSCLYLLSVGCILFYFPSSVENNLLKWLHCAFLLFWTFLCCSQKETKRQVITVEALRRTEGVIPNKHIFIFTTGTTHKLWAWGYDDDSVASTHCKHGIRQIIVNRILQYVTLECLFYVMFIFTSLGYTYKPI